MEYFLLKSLQHTVHEGTHTHTLHNQPIISTLGHTTSTEQTETHQEQDRRIDIQRTRRNKTHTQIKTSKAIHTQRQRCIIKIEAFSIAM
jgi:uncharacterized protein (UPF0218 family)